MAVRLKVPNNNKRVATGTLARMQSFNHELVNLIKRTGPFPHFRRSLRI
jgi:hypothetical protein